MWIKLLIVSLCLTGCSGWTVNGIPAERLIHAEPREYAQLTAGVATSFAAHWLAHVAYLEANGIEWEQRGLEERITQPTSTKQRQWMGRIGFVGQIAGGVVLKYSPWSEGWFATGYHAGTLIETATYPVIWGWNDGDLGFIGDSAEIEWVAYTAASVWLLEPRKN